VAVRHPDELKHRVGSQQWEDQMNRVNGRIQRDKRSGG
jgi:hypothetical protein